MKRILYVAALALAVPVLATAQPSALKLDQLSRLSSQAKETVDVTLDSSLLQLAAAFIPSEQKDTAAIKALLAGLTGIYVKSFEFDREGLYSDADVEAVRVQLKAPWSRIVSINSRQDRERVEVYMWRENDQPGGLAVLVSEPNRSTRHGRCSCFVTSS